MFVEGLVDVAWASSNEKSSLTESSLAQLVLQHESINDFQSLFTAHCLSLLVKFYQVRLGIVKWTDKLAEKEAVHEKNGYKKLTLWYNIN